MSEWLTSANQTGRKAATSETLTLAAASMHGIQWKRANKNILFSNKRGWWERGKIKMDAASRITKSKKVSNMKQNVEEKEDEEKICQKQCCQKLCSTWFCFNITFCGVITYHSLYIEELGNKLHKNILIFREYMFATVTTWRIDNICRFEAYEFSFKVQPNSTYLATRPQS